MKLVVLFVGGPLDAQEHPIPGADFAAPPDTVQIDVDGTVHAYQHHGDGVSDCGRVQSAVRVVRAYLYVGSVDVSGGGGAGRARAVHPGRRGSGTGQAPTAAASG